MLRERRKSKYYRGFLLAVFGVLLAAALFSFSEKLGLGNEITSPVVQVRYINEPAPTVSPSPTTRPSPVKSATPSAAPAKKPSVIIDVPFLVQAPFANWDALHEDACEEASLINVKYFLDKKPAIDKTIGEKEIQDMVAFENRNGYGPSVTLQELNTIAKDYYGLKNGRVVTNATIEDIKNELRNGKPVIVGAAGKVLPNPFFKNNGPNYHMLVIKGYDDSGLVPLNKCKRIDADSCKQTPGIFITNDVGVSQGKDFLYTYDGLLKAIHDWDPKNILNGQKAYFIFD